MVEAIIGNINHLSKTAI